MLKWVHLVDKDVRYVLMCLFLLLMAVQSVLGIGWMTENIAHLPAFQETYLLSDAAETLVVDEYMGIMYPLLIKAAKWLAGIVKIPYYTLLYVLQMSAAGCAAVYLLRCSGWIPEGGKRCKMQYGIVVAYILTFPLLLQMHMAVLPYSLAMSIAVILVCDGLYYLRHVDEVQGVVLVKLCGLWVLDVLLLPDYSWIMGVFVAAVLCRIMAGNREWRSRIFICFISTVLCFGVIGQNTQIPGSMGRIQKTVGASLLSRFVWPNFVSYSHFWPEEIRETFELDELTSFSRYSESTVYEFGSVLEEKYGREPANEIYRDMALTALGLDTRQILIDAGRDFMSYLCPQAAFQQQRADNKSALLAWNYGRLQDRAPLLTKYYVNISFAGWNVMCAVSLLMILLKRRGGVKSCAVVVLGVSTLFVAFWYTMQGAGIQDYKKVMLISLIWLLPIIRGYTLTEECE